MIPDDDADLSDAVHLLNTDSKTYEAWPTICSTDVCRRTGLAGSGPSTLRNRNRGCPVVTWSVAPDQLDNVALRNLKARMTYQNMDVHSTKTAMRPISMVELVSSNTAAPHTATAKAIAEPMRRPQRSSCT